MNIQALMPRASSTGDSSSASQPNSAQVMSNTFIQLLVAQLKSQSPLNPVDPTQFVGQLAQFDQLSEVMQIRQLMQQFASGLGTTHPTQGGH
ncbi:MAG TPA: flagellar hook capping FlgD N-terminal domain-containing protein [Terriglobales bacterium]|nr:flagellar hook capping FlgD N-terminal domain-containing protein [Terriglobales bacterium]